MHASEQTVPDVSAHMAARLSITASHTCECLSAMKKLIVNRILKMSRGNGFCESS
jgi:hypothetical protein